MRFMKKFFMFFIQLMSSCQNSAIPTTSEGRALTGMD
jgi:hypothetical protein